MLNIKMDKGDKVQIGVTGGIKDIAAEISMAIKLIRDQIKEGSGEEALKYFDECLSAGLIAALDFKDDGKEKEEEKKPEEPSEDKDKAELMKEVEKMLKEIFK